MRAFIALVIVVGLLFVQASAALPKDPHEYSAWEARLLESVNKAVNLPPEEAIPRLGKLVWQLSKGSNMEHGDRPVFKAARSNLLAIQGHAKWFGDEIKEITDKEIARVPTGRHSSARAWNFQTLEFLPSPETVEVLGELLFDERDPWKAWKDVGSADSSRPYANSIHAAHSLHRLGIRNPPVTSKYPESGDLRTWQLWFEQVKAGSRTFSFEGDKTTYNLAGPVRVTPRDGRSKLEHQARGSNDGEGIISERSPSLLVKIALAIALLAVGFTFWRMKNRAR